MSVPTSPIVAAPPDGAGDAFIDRMDELVGLLMAKLAYEPAADRETRRKIYAALLEGHAYSERLRRWRSICAGCQGTYPEHVPVPGHRAEAGS